jgi:hypothetical protein
LKSKTIIETNMGGIITIRNVDGGAELLITNKNGKSKDWGL